MQIDRITCVFFSATGLTQKTAVLFTDAFGAPVKKVDITPFSAEDVSLSFGPSELVVFAAPVYGGRIPAAAARRFSHLKGNHTPAVVLAVFGNRDYDDALLEMQDIALAGGFVPVAAAAPVAQHSLMPRVAKGRPDEKDASLLAAFAARVQQYLRQASPQELTVPAVKGKRPYQAYPKIPFQPAASSACVKCGVCAQACPTGAISPANPAQTDASRCISCMRCVAVCPHGARGINKLLQGVAQAAFLLKYGARKEPEFFLASEKR